jgi:hypothetical protein
MHLFFRFCNLLQTCNLSKTSSVETHANQKCKVLTALLVVRRSLNFRFLGTTSRMGAGISRCCDSSLLRFMRIIYSNSFRSMSPYLTRYCISSFLIMFQNTLCLTFLADGCVSNFSDEGYWLLRLRSVTCTSGSQWWIQVSSSAMIRFRKFRFYCGHFKGQQVMSKRLALVLCC